MSPVPGQRLRLLCVEDRPDDAELIRRELREAGYDVVMRRVETSHAMREALREEWDVVTSDHVMPLFDSRAALAVLKETGKDVPFLLVSGSIGEEEAAETMRLGMRDYILKENLSRLVPSCEREIEEARNRARKRVAEERVAENERELRAIFEVSGTGLATIDFGGRRILRCNEYFRSLLALPEGSISDVDPWSLFHAGEASKIADALERLQSGEGRVAIQELRCAGREDPPLWTLASLAPIPEPKGGFPVVVSLTDLSERLRMEDELKAVIRSRDKFLSIASHELQTPLSVLKLHLQIMRTRLSRRGEVGGAGSPHPAVPGSLGAVPATGPDGDAWERFLDIAERNVQRLSRLVTDMLDTSMIRLDTFSLHLEQVDLRDLVANVVEGIRPDVERTGSCLDVHYSESCVGLWDRHRVEQAVVNLLTNAARYGNGKPIEISVRCEGGWGIVEIRDHGRGIPESRMGRIFEPFERAISENEVSGLGLGLYVVRKVAEALGGNVSVDSRFGEGSRFELRLPLRRGESGVPAEE